MSKLHFSKYRIYAAGSVILVIIGASVAKVGIGTYCSVCPLGFLQVTAASRSIPVDMLVGTLIGVIAVLVLGRFFCAWLCTTNLVRHMFSGAKKTNGAKRNKRLSKLPLAILFLTIGLSFILRCPIFCIVCPIGLFFGFIYSVIKFLFVLEPGWNLVIFPVMIAVEILIFKRWCSYICPISALFSIISKIPFVKLRPNVNKSTCISCTGGTCTVCSEVCPENLEIIYGGSEILKECTNCMGCIDECPSHSISYNSNADEIDDEF